MWNEHIFSPHNSILTTFALTRVWTEGFNHQPGRPKPQSTVGIPDETLGFWSSPLFMDLPFIPWATMAVIPISHTTGKIIWGVTCLSFIFSQSDKPADAINLRARWGIGHGSMKDRITIPNASCWLRPEREHCVNIVSTLLIFFFSWRTTVDGRRERWEAGLLRVWLNTSVFPQTTKSQRQASVIRN